MRTLGLRRFGRIVALAMAAPMLLRGALTVTAQDADAPPDPPDLGDVVLEDALTDGNVIPVGTCPTGRPLGQSVGEGLRLKVQGPCRPDDKDASVQVLVRGLGVQDGEVAIDFKEVAGVERAGVYLYAQVLGRSYLACYLNPTDGTARLIKSVDGEISVLAEREDLDRRIDATDWNRAALRSNGAEIWLLVNDEPLLYSDDAPLGAGRAGVGMVRTGSLTDAQEAAVVLRNLTVTALADGDPERAPAYQAP